VGACRSGVAAVLLVVSVCAAGCSQGVREFGQYTEAFNLQYQQGDEFLNTVAKAERTLFAREEARGSPFPRFNLSQAAYYVDTVDPPVTASIRGSLKSLKLYNDALSALTNGEAAGALTDKVGALVTNAAVTVAATQVALGPAAKALEADKLVAGVSKNLADVTPIFKQLLTWASREAFREQLIAAYPTMKGLLRELRDNGTPAMFSAVKRYRRDGANTATGFSPAAIELLKKDREQLAGWVLLLDRTLNTMDLAVTAAMSESPEALLTTLSDTSIELKVLAEKVKSLKAK